MNDLPSCVRAKKLLLISDACAAAGFTFFALHPILGVRATKDRPKHPLPRYFLSFCLLPGPRCTSTWNIP